MAETKSDSAHMQMHTDPFSHSCHVDPHSLPFTPLPTASTASSSSSSSSSSPSNKVTLLHLGYIHSFRGLWCDDAWDTDSDRREKKRRTPYSLPVFGAVIQRADGKVWLWDLGLRNDEACLPPAVHGFGKMLGGTELPEHAQLSTLLQSKGISMDKIEGIILSHCHFDHYGRLDDFPTSLPVYVGPGTMEWVKGGDTVEGGLKSFPGKWLKDGRKWVVVGEGEQWEKKKNSVGAYQEGWDLFGDGTCFIVKAEGHCPGHLSLVVESSPGSWLVLGGDAGHNQSLYLPIPPQPHSSTTDRRSVPAKFKLSPSAEDWTCMQDSIDLTWTTLSRMTRMEAEENVMVLLGHESEVATSLGLKPGDTLDLTGWKEKGLKEKKDQEGDRGRKELEQL